MSDKNYREKFINFRAEVEALPKFNGRTAFIRKLTDHIDFLGRYKTSGEKIGELMWSERQAEFNDFKDIINQNNEAKKR